MTSRSPRRKEAVYVDTSLWCAYCFNEKESEAAVDWISRADFEAIGTSWWTETEFASALGIQLRKKALTKSQADRARERFDEVLDMVRRLDVVEQDFLEAANRCADAAHGLRGGDALHLAVAARHGCTSVATLDREMKKNAKRLGLKVIELA